MNIQTISISHQKDKIEKELQYLKYWRSFQT